MNRRVWGIVAVFASIAALLLMWSFLSSDADPEPQGTATAHPSLRPQAVKMERVKLDPNRTRMSVRDMAARQQRATGVARSPEGLADGVFPLDQEGIDRAVRERQTDMQACYETALFHTPGISGKMTLALRIEPDAGQPWGRVASVESDSTLDATVLEGCLATVFEELRFDAREPITIRYPITFEPGGPPASDE